MLTGITRIAKRLFLRSKQALAPGFFLLLAVTSSAWGAEMVSNGIFSGSTGWTFTTATYDGTTTRTASSGSAKLATVSKGVAINGTVSQAVSIPAGSTINTTALYSQLVVVGAGSATGNRISIDLHYTGGSTVNILSTGDLTAHTWTVRNGTGLTLTQDVDQIIITMNALSAGGGGTQTATMYMDEVAISYTTYSDPLLHNSNNLGTKYWSANNGWGTAAGQYGEFTCATCHNRDAANIKRVVDSIPATIGTAVLKPVKFNNVTAFGNDAGGHTTSQRICEVCHTQTSVHKYNQTTGDLNHKSANLTDCTSCHAHNKSFGASCNTCHGYPPINATLGTDGLASPATGVLDSGQAGAHATHVNVRGMTCETCHQGYTQNPMGNDAIEFGFNINEGTIAGFKGTFNGGSFAVKTPNAPYNGTSTYAGTTVDMATGNNNTCSNLYCHGGYSGSNGSMTAPSWTSGAAAKACGACHATSQATPPTSGNHARHTGTAAGQMGIACSDCHGTLPADNAHVNGNVVTKLNAASKLRANATYKGFANQSSAALSYGTCAVYCHSTVQTVDASAVATPSVTPAWGGVPFVSCDTSACHGNPPANANHTTHVNAGYDCAICHSTAGKDTAKHADYNIDVAFSGVAGSGTYSQATNTPGNGFGTCSATYCHSGAATPPAWNGTAMPADCTGCHGNEVNASAELSGAHNAHMNNTNQGGAFKCSSCHAPTIANTDNRTITTSSLHVNGLVNYSGLYAGKTKTCSTFYCHSNGKGGAPVTAIPSWASGTTLGCNGCHGTTGNTSGMPSPDAVGVNSHVKHLPSQDTTKCVFCHRTTVNGTNAIIVGSQHINNARDVRFSKPSSYTNYSGVYNAGAKTCSTSYCHGTAASDAWGTAGPLACNKCHDSSNALPGAHGIHYNTATVTTGLYGAVPGTSSQSATAYQFACSACHGTDTNAHADYPKTAVSDATIFFGFSSAGRGATANTAYVRQATGLTDTKGYDWTNGGNGNCTATYCHSNGRGSNGGSTTVNWGITARDASCGTCHGNATTTIAGTNPATTPNMLSGAHKSHIGNAAGGGSFGCVACHATTVSSDTAIAANAYGKHVNKFADYSGAYAGKNKTCSTFTCHSNGKGGAPLVSVTTTATWNSGASLDCSGCHGSTSANLTTGNHAAHLLKGAACANCHWNTTQAANTIFSATQHINRTASVNQGGTFTIGGAVGFTGTTNCSAITCHGSGAPAATWGNTLKCDGCHPTLSGAHTRHAGLLSLTTDVTFYAYTSNKSAGAEGAPVKYGFGCASCHPLDEAGKHMNGVIDVEMSPTVAGYTVGSLRTKNGASAQANVITSGSNVTCDQVYCHSNGSAAPTGTNATNWYAGFAITDRCANCHGNSPTTGAHTAHQVGLHYNNVFNGTSGKLAAAASGSSSHGVAGQSTTITCNTCHYKTVITSANDQNALCNTCHTKGVNGALVKGVSAIAELSFHVNGKVDFGFPTTPLKIVAKAQLRTASFDNYSGLWVRNGGNYKNGASAYDTAKVALSNSMWTVGGTPGTSTCSNISCHNLRTGQTVKWNDVLTCKTCHTKL